MNKSIYICKYYFILLYAISQYIMTRNDIFFKKESCYETIKNKSEHYT